MCQLDQLPTSRCRCTASYFLFSSLLHLICFNLFHRFDALPFIVWVHLMRFHTFSFAREMAGGWPLKTGMPFLRYLPDVSCDPKSMAGNPRRNICIATFTQIHMKRISTLSVLWALLSNPCFFGVNFWVWTLCKNAGHPKYRKLLSKPQGLSGQVNWM